MFERFFYLLRRVLRNMRQSPFLSVAAVGTVAVSLTILALFALVVLNVQKLTGRWSEEMQVVAYLEQPPEAAQLETWTAELGALPEVDSVSFVSQQEALERFRTRLAGDADLLDGVEPEVLPASLELTLQPEHRNRQSVAALVARLQQAPAFSDLRYGQEWLERFESFLLLLRAAGAILGGFLLFATLFIVANTIKLTLYARREELEIMTLVGATPFFVKLPFLLEGALQGAAGGVLALVGSYGLFALCVREGLGSLIPLSGLDQIAFLTLPLQLALLAAGTLLGLCGSLFSLRKFVRI